MQNNQTKNARMSLMQAQGLILAVLFICSLLTSCGGNSSYDTVKTEVSEETLQKDIVIVGISPTGVVTADVVGQYSNSNPYDKVLKREVTNYQWHDYRKLEGSKISGALVWKTYGHPVLFTTNGSPLSIGSKADLVCIKETRTLRNGEQYTQIERIEVRPTNVVSKTKKEEGKLPGQTAQTKTQGSP